ncbi:MAG: bifunctional tetrahydrofolate synthase/dihydrofolate synthase [Gammaproteobacteria bacterium]|nr:bifunctional tetrahydrofolate synthase/dihydrofolate synthase [Gammaproteobacteria bacterium]
MRFTTLAQWLSWQEQLHPATIDLGLERVREVYQRLFSDEMKLPLVITVAGTNGKGSTVAVTESILIAAGYRVGCYTSPHLQRYQERIRIQGEEIDEASLCAAFAAIDGCRGEISLTYFEFGTLAAIWILAREALDLWILEVGLGGRLDAVNIIDPDLAIITAIDIDHRAWLGDDRETIAREKGGILRPGIAAICSDPQPPQSLLTLAAEIGTRLYCLNRDFFVEEKGEGRWQFRSAQQQFDLPTPPLKGRFQLDNCGGVVMGLALLQQRLKVNRQQMEAGLRRATLSGRFGRLQQKPGVIVDVAHNRQAVEALATLLRQHPCSGQRIAIFSLLKDKDGGAIVAAMGDLIAQWWVVSSSGERGVAAPVLAEVVRSAGGNAVQIATTTAEAVASVLEQAADEDEIIVFGSFQLVAEAMKIFPEGEMVTVGRNGIGGTEDE